MASAGVFSWFLGLRHHSSLSNADCVLSVPPNMPLAVGELREVCARPATSCERVASHYHQVRTNTAEGQGHCPHCGKRTVYTKLFSHRAGKESKQAKA